MVIYFEPTPRPWRFNVAARDIFDSAAVSADEMMVMVVGEPLFIERFLAVKVHPTD